MSDKSKTIIQLPLPAHSESNIYKKLAAELIRDHAVPDTKPAISNELAEQLLARVDRLIVLCHQVLKKPIAYTALSCLVR